MNTTAAAAHAGVTVTTIRTWCRNGVITAAKTAGRWTINAASLARRITIGNLKTRTETTMQPPFVLTAKTSTRGVVGVIGPADALAEAFKTRTPITLNGKLAGEQVYLGHTYLTYDDGISSRTTGLDRTIGQTDKYPGVEMAVYLVDMDRLDGAPTLQALHRKVEGMKARGAMETEQRALADQDRVEREMNEGDL